MAQNLVVTGKFLGAKATQFVGQNNYAVRLFYLDMTENPEYPNTPEFRLSGDKVNLVDNLQPGQQIQVKFNLDGRKYDKTAEGGKKGVIVNLNAWQINVIQTTSAAHAPTQQRQAPAPAAPAMTGPGQYASQQRVETAAALTPGHPDNDLPF